MNNTQSQASRAQAQPRRKGTIKSIHIIDAAQIMGSGMPREFKDMVQDMLGQDLGEENIIEENIIEENIIEENIIEQTAQHAVNKTLNQFQEAFKAQQEAKSARAHKEGRCDCHRMVRTEVEKAEYATQLFNKMETTTSTIKRLLEGAEHLLKVTKRDALEVGRTIHPAIVLCPFTNRVYGMISYDQTEKSNQVNHTAGADRYIVRLHQSPEQAYLVKTGIAGVSDLIDLSNHRLSVSELVIIANLLRRAKNYALGLSADILARAFTNDNSPVY